MKLIPGYIIYLTGFFSGLCFFFSSLHYTDNRTRFIWFLFFGIMLGLLTGFLTWQNHIWKENKSTNTITPQKLADVGAEFRDGFTNEIRLLRERYHEFGQKPDFKTTHDIIKAGLTKHELAWLRFREFLTDDKQIRLDKLWMKYSYENKKLPGDPFWGYKVPQKWDKKFGTIEAENKIRNIALDRIYKLFDFTKT